MGTIKVTVKEKKVSVGIMIAGFFILFGIASFHTYQLSKVQESVQALSDSVRAYSAEK